MSGGTLGNPGAEIGSPPLIFPPLIFPPLIFISADPRISWRVAELDFRHLFSPPLIFPPLIFPSGL